MRLRLVAPFGMTVMDYTREGDTATLWTMAPVPPGTDLTLLRYLGADDALAPGVCEFFGHTSGVVMYRCTGSYGRRTVYIDWRTATLRAVDDWDSGVSRSYDDYRVVDGIPLPHHISISLRNGDAAVEIYVDRYEVNPLLDAAAFTPAPGAQQIPVSGSP